MKNLFCLFILIFVGCQSVSHFKSGSYLKKNFSHSVKSDGLIFYYSLAPDGGLNFLIKNTSNMLIRNIDVEFSTEKGERSDYRSFSMLKNLGTRQFMLKNIKDTRTIVLKYRYVATPEDLFIKPEDKQKEYLSNLITGELFITLP